MVGQSTIPDIVLFDEIGSTNDWLKQAILSGDESRATVRAIRQTTGRGRMDRSWLSPVGGLYLSASTPVAAAATPIFYSVAFGVAAARTLNSLASVAVRLKWPNDLVAQGVKVAGLLAELVTPPDAQRHVVAGIGVNVNTPIPPDGMRYPASSLVQIAGREWDLEELAAKLVQAVFTMWDNLEASSPARLLSDWLGLSEFKVGEMLAVETLSGRQTGAFLGVSEQFELRLATADGERCFAEGDCRRVRSG
ncbi:MAG: biotin--[acetyl-CoA-carboxylase] ligase [Myxococcales bacterium]|nr:MAG: biotin--[acetyl-CoA-carboxylase] ligase [Myxococcales bacterium]